jgi:hypothetical protein
MHPKIFVNNLKKNIDNIFEPIYHNFTGGTPQRSFEMKESNFFVHGI